MISSENTQRKVVIQVTIEYEISVPMDWSPDQINAYRNHSRFCQDNMLDELIRLSEKEGCLCDYVITKYLREANDVVEIESDP